MAQLPHHVSETCSVDAPEPISGSQTTPSPNSPSYAPEAVHDLRGTPPEIPFPTAPERAREDQNNLEIVLGQGLEATPQPPSPNLAKRRDSNETLEQKVSWRWVLAITFFIIAVAIGGGLGASLPQLKYNPESSYSAFYSDSSWPKFPDYTLLLNTSIAATSCIPGDRWVFAQDLTGAIRAAQFSSSASTWTSTSQQLNFTPVKLGTALSASCTSISYRPGMSPGSYISLVYLNQTSALQQSVLNGKSWKNCPVFQASNAPETDTRLSTSTQSGWAAVHMENSNISVAIFSSVAVYRHNRSLVMIDIDPFANIPEDPHLNENLLSTIEESQNLNFIDFGFACVSGQSVPNDTSLLFTKCSTGDSLKSRDVWPSVNIRSFYYDTFASSNSANPIAANSSVATSSKISENHHWESSFYGPTLFGADISMATFSDSKIAFIYLTPNYTIALAITEAYSGLSQLNVQEASSTILHYPFFSATSLSSNSTSIYAYYQVNETSIGEMIFDTAKNDWVPGPVHISFFQNSTSSGNQREPSS